MIEPDRPQMAIEFGAQKMQECRHPLKIFNTFCFFHGNNGYANALQSYDTRTVPRLFSFPLSLSFH
jgi:hypothetical protein